MREQKAVRAIGKQLAEIQERPHRVAFEEALAAGKHRGSGGRHARGEKSAAGEDAAHDARSGLTT